MLGDQLGWRGGESVGDEAYSDEEQRKLSQCVAEALRRFYYCGIHNWSFLKPFLTVTLASGASTIEMPDTFGGLEGGIRVSDSSSGIYQPMPIVNPQKVDALYAKNPAITGSPTYASIRVVPGSNNNQHSQREELYIFPIADASYSLKLQYYIRTPALDGNHPFAFGGPEHVSTILAGCLVVAEKWGWRPQMGAESDYMQRLVASIAIDQRKKAQMLGGDTSREQSDIDDNWQAIPIQINGTVYD